MQQIDLIRGEELTAALKLRWDQILRQDELLHSPFLRPEFAEAVAAVRDDVEIAVLKECGEIRGFFPFHRDHFNVGTPVGGHLSNQQALITTTPDDWDIRKILGGCNLSAWNFDNLVASQTAFENYHYFTEPCHFLDLSRGYDGYVEQRCQCKAKHFMEIFRKERKLAREAGGLRFELHTDDVCVLQTLLDWKTNRCEHSGTFNLFAFNWTTALLGHILENPSERFAGLLSVLYAGDEPAAISYDLVSESAADGWLIAFNPKFSKYSTGFICALKKAKALAARGIQKLYLGRGKGRYKELLSSSSVMLAEGTVDCNLVRGTGKRVWTKTREWIRASPLRNPAKQIKRLLEPLESRRLSAVETKLSTDHDTLTPGSQNQ
ncbi:MAG: GNAT family N-acetyltransferase [Planctomycetes bacterium]|nr:GNAT family N-acetyltransferase [Planctomycetota bacterium]